MKLGRWRLAPAGATLAAGLVVVALGVWAPERYKLLLQEDGPAEWLTFFGFAVAAAMFLREAVRRGERLRLERAALVALAIFCIFVAGEEISWGQRLFSFQPPELFLQSNFQQESNLHNLLKDIFDSRWQVFIVALGYGLLAPLLAWRGWLPRYLAPDPMVAPAAAAVALLELLYPLELAGEVAEMLLGACFVHDAATRRAGSQQSGGRRATAVMCACAVAAWCMPPLLDATLYRPDPQSVARARSELDALAAHLAQGGTKPRLFTMRRVHKRLFTAAKAGYLQAPSSADDAGGEATDATRRRYLLDPWQQPYWIMFEPRTRTEGVALLYSFGPNRRRDTLLERVPSSPRFQPSGDDMAVLQRVTQKTR